MLPVSEQKTIKLSFIFVESLHNGSVHRRSYILLKVQKWLLRPELRRINAVGGNFSCITMAFLYISIHGRLLQNGCEEQVISQLTVCIVFSTYSQK